MTETQLNEVRNYLLSKKLPNHLLIELQDHFINQTELFLREGKGFEEALLGTKLLWKKDLQMVKADWFSFKSITRIEKQYFQKMNQNVLRNALIFSAMVLVISLYFNYVFTPVFLALAIVVAIMGLVALIMKKVKFNEFLFIGFQPVVLRLFAFWSLVSLFAPVVSEISIFSHIKFSPFINSLMWVSLSAMQVQLWFLTIRGKKVFL